MMVLQWSDFDIGFNPRNEQVMPQSYNVSSPDGLSPF